MHSLVAWPVLIVLAGAASCVPAVQDPSHRSALIWVVLPCLLLGVIAAYLRFGGI